MGVFPSKMKIAEVVPLFKCGEKNVFTNYRPISLLPEFSKILERLYNNKMDKFLKKYDILSPSQYGFRSNMSTTHALLELVEEITSSLDNNKYAIGVFIDLKKAFDTVDHDILAKKLHFNGVRGVAHKWILSYLENRQQFVNFNNCDSEIQNVSCGVPQGSILGPKLFIIYINDICKVSKVFKFILFADLLCCHSDLNELVRMIHTGLDQLQVWFSVNRLSLNVTKTNYMFFGNRKLIVHISVKINKETINRVNVTKFLGVMIDDKLNWKNHICLVNCCIVSFLAVYYVLCLSMGQHICNKCSMFSYITEKGYKVILWCQETGPYNYAIL